MRVPMKEVPLQVRRTAAQHLESLRGTEIMYGAEAARLGDHAVPIYRPDIEGVAYWEFSVVHGGRRHILTSRGYASDVKCAGSGSDDSGGSMSNGSGREPIGFIIASNGRHDFPVVHWSLDRLPPSLQAAPSGVEETSKGGPKRLYRLDALCYVAEGDNDEILGQSGQIPAPIRGLPHDLARYAGQIVSSIARVRRPERSDETAEKAEHEFEGSKRAPPELSRDDEGGWKRLKESYADRFGPLLDQLRKRATTTWEIDDAIREFGEGIVTGETHRVALLGEARVELVGDGAKYVRATIEERGAPALVLAAAPVALPHEVDFDVVVNYQDGECERLRFFVVSRDAPSNTKAEQARLRATDDED